MKEKLRIAKDGELKNILSSKSKRNSDHKSQGASEENGESKTLDMVQQFNDEAVEKYSPSRYDGHAVIFKPRVNYDNLPDPRMGWGDVVENIEIVELDLNPHAMLVEPFVKELSNRILEFLIREPTNSGNDKKPEIVIRGGSLTHRACQRNV